MRCCYLCRRGISFPTLVLFSWGEVWEQKTGIGIGAQQGSVAASSRTGTAGTSVFLQRNHLVCPLILFEKIAQGVWLYENEQED